MSLGAAIRLAAQCDGDSAREERWTNDAMISIGRIASTVRSRITAGLSIDAKAACFTVHASSVQVTVTPSGCTSTEPATSCPSMGYAYFGMRNESLRSCIQIVRRPPLLKHNCPWRPW